MSVRREPSQLTTSIIVGSVMFMAGTLDAVAFLQSNTVLGIVGVAWAVAAAGLVIISVRRVRRAQPRRD